MDLHRSIASASTRKVEALSPYRMMRTVSSTKGPWRGWPGVGAGVGIGSPPSSAVAVVAASAVSTAAPSPAESPAPAPSSAVVSSDVASTAASSTTTTDASPPPVYASASSPLPYAPNPISFLQSATPLMHFNPREDMSPYAGWVAHSSSPPEGQRMPQFSRASK